MELYTCNQPKHLTGSLWFNVKVTRAHHPSSGPSSNEARQGTHEALQKAKALSLKPLNQACSSESTSRGLLSPTVQVIAAVAASALSSTEKARVQLWDLHMYVYRNT